MHCLNKSYFLLTQPILCKQLAISISYSFTPINVGRGREIFKRNKLKHILSNVLYQ